MNIIISDKLISFIDYAKGAISRPVYILKCVSYIQIKGVTLNELDNTIHNYECKHNDKPNKPNKERKN